MSRRLLTCGEHAVLVELDGLEEVMALDHAARAAVAAKDPAFADVTDIIPAARTLLLMVREGARVEPVRTALPSLALPPTTLRAEWPGSCGRRLCLACGRAAHRRDPRAV